MRQQPVLEKCVTTKIMRALKGSPHVVVRKRHGTVMGVAGDPDLYGIVNGRHFEIEVKRPNDPSSQLTELQAQRLMEWKSAGAVTGVARSVDDALVILGLKRPEQQSTRTKWCCSGCRQYAWEGEDPPARCPCCGETRFEKETQ